MVIRDENCQKWGKMDSSGMATRTGFLIPEVCSVWMTEWMSTWSSTAKNAIYRLEGVNFYNGYRKNVVYKGIFWEVLSMWTELQSGNSPRESGRKKIFKSYTNKPNPTKRKEWQFVSPSFTQTIQESPVCSKQTGVVLWGHNALCSSTFHYWVNPSRLVMLWDPKHPVDLKGPLPLGVSTAPGGHFRSPKWCPNTVCDFLLVWTCVSSENEYLSIFSFIFFPGVPACQYLFPCILVPLFWNKNMHQTNLIYAPSWCTLHPGAVLGRNLPCEHTK